MIMVIISAYYQNIIYKKIFSNDNLERVLFFELWIFFIWKKRENEIDIIQLYQNMSVSHCLLSNCLLIVF
jgi:hypothetical protein